MNEVYLNKRNPIFIVIVCGEAVIPQDNCHFTHNFDLPGLTSTKNSEAHVYIFKTIKEKVKQYKNL